MSSEFLFLHISTRMLTFKFFVRLIPIPIQFPFPRLGGIVVIKLKDQWLRVRGFEPRAPLGPLP